ncbi:MAG: hypothetical protein A4E63_02783 [Syntrophorhabdus sp. PtaU1.Bin050]|nr:MAG: hypothetical protein A4E63_02783 [Syntrophorhabdus sp. PtaU1.Bin050]
MVEERIIRDREGGDKKLVLLCPVERTYNQKS